MLEEKEDLIVGLQTTAFKNKGTAERLKAQLSSSENKIRDLRENLDAAKDEKRNLSREIGRVTDALKLEIKLKERTKANTSAQLEDLTDKVADLESKLH